MMLAERGFASDRITSGPHKGRKGWRGLGLRVDPSDSPESFEVNRANHSSSNGERSNPNNPTTNGAQGSIEEQPMHDNGSPSERLVNDGSPQKNPDFAGKTVEEEEVNDSEPAPRILTGH